MGKKSKYPDYSTGTITVNGKTVAVTFEEVFKERNIGTNFDTAKVAKVQNLIVKKKKMLHQKVHHKRKR